MPAWRDYLTLKLVNIFLFLWFTAANFFIFTLAFNLKDGVPPKYGYGLGKETLLTPSPWIFGVLFAVHLLFAGTILYTQWTDRGEVVVIHDIGLQFPILLALSTVWAGLWVRQLAIPSFILAALVALVASNIFITLKNAYPLMPDSDVQEQVFVHLPFSLYHGWTMFILIVNGYTAFAPTAAHSGTLAKVTAVWLIAMLSGISVSYAVSTRGGDIAGGSVITLGLFAILSHHQNHIHAVCWMHWTTFVLAIVSTLAVVKSAVGTWLVCRGGQVRLEETGGQAA